MSQAKRSGSFLLVVLLAAVGSGSAGEADETEAPHSLHRRPNLLLLTLDTTRADHLGAYGAGNAATPVIDSLAAAGVRYRRALTPSPLTLPAHASLMTGLEPPEHGIRVNGTRALSTNVPTLAAVLADNGFDTAAFIASRVLDRRFGLGLGFQLYNDRMTAERLGEYGYPERDAAAVTSAAVAWLRSVPADRPFFMWVHYYDAHAPYDPPGAPADATPAQRYAGEIAFMDREIGRLLAALAERSTDHVVALAGDHGESLGDHGERSHGVFLYEAGLHVPLLLAGTGVPRGRVVDGTVSIRRLPVTLLRLLDAELESPLPGPVLPGIFTAPADGLQPAVYSETRMPTTAYGWAPLRALSDDRWRLIEAPRLELYDLAMDPGETENLATEHPAVADRMLTELEELDLEPAAESPPVESDPALAAALRGLGYLDSGGEAGSIDPKDGIWWLGELDRAISLAARGDNRAALVALESLVARNPENVPFLTHLAGAQLAAGRTDAAIATYRQAIGLNPDLEFLHLNLADALGRVGRTREARLEYESVLALDPRSAVAWLKLAEAAHGAGNAAEEKRLLADAVEAEASSGVVHHRLGQIASREGDLAGAEHHFRRASELIPGWISPWLGRAEAAAREDRLDDALASYRRAIEIEPRNATALLGLVRVLDARGEAAEAGRHLERLLATAPTSREAQEGRALLIDRE